MCFQFLLEYSNIRVCDPSLSDHFRTLLMSLGKKFISTIYFYLVGAHHDFRESTTCLESSRHAADAQRPRPARLRCPGAVHTKRRREHFSHHSPALRARCWQCLRRLLPAPCACACLALASNRSELWCTCEGAFMWINVLLIGPSVRLCMML